MLNPAPCKRPRVVVVEDRHNKVHGAHCQVPGCDWRYGPGVKTDVEWQATRHRREHRDAVPACAIEKADDGWLWVSCACGIRRRQSTRTDATKWREYHLSHDHGLVTCP